MRSPSTIGVGDAKLFFGLSSIVPGDLKTSTSSKDRPVSRSKAIKRSEVSRFTAVADVSHTRPFATTGDDHPRPATGTFHATFFVSLHSSGRPRSHECP